MQNLFRLFAFLRVEEYAALTTTRCANTGTASGLKSSGTQKLRLCRNAMAWAALYSMSAPRGDTPSDRYSDSRVRRTISRV